MAESADGQAVASKEAEATDARGSGGPPSEQERKAKEYMDQAERKVASASTFLGRMMG